MAKSVDSERPCWRVSTFNLECHLPSWQASVRGLSRRVSLYHREHLISHMDRGNQVNMSALEEICHRYNIRYQPESKCSDLGWDGKDDSGCDGGDDSGDDGGGDCGDDGVDGAGGGGGDCGVWCHNVAPGLLLSRRETWNTSLHWDGQLLWSLPVLCPSLQAV